MNDHQKYVLSAILKLTGDTKSRGFWLKALKNLGAYVVAEDLAVTQDAMLRRSIKSPTRYLTKLLKERLDLQPSTKKEPLKKLDTYFAKTQAELFNNMVPAVISKEEKGISGNMAEPYSGKNIPWTTFIGPEFFTLSTNKKKSDKINAVFRLRNNENIEVPMIRGKLSASDTRERGIPTIQHQRVLAALKLQWAKQGCKTITGPDGSVFCYVDCGARELAKLLGWKNIGGWQLRQLKNLIMDLKSMPYCLDFKNSNVKGIENFYFSLIGDFSGFDKIEKGKRTSYFRVTFSAAVSYGLIHREAVIRPKGMIQIKSELAALLWLYLEPNLRANGHALINLSNLIKVLHLPEAAWHKYKSTRKQEFEKAIKDLRTQRLADGRQMVVEIKEGLYDWQLSAYLKGYSIQLPGETEPGN